MELGRASAGEVWSGKYDISHAHKAAASDGVAQIAFSRLPMCSLISNTVEETQANWQKEWEECTKTRTTKEFFPKVQNRQKIKIDVTAILTAILRGHGKTRSYLHRFKILEKADCPCGNGDQTSDHLLYQCAILNKQREIFQRNVIKCGNWPAGKQEIISRHQKSFLLFLKSINFDLL
jgi:hypothetical protein